VIVEAIMSALAEMKVQGAVIATAFAVAYISVEAVKRMRAAAAQDADNATRKLRGDGFDPVQTALEYPELLTEEELSDAIQQAASDGLIEPEEVQHSFPDLMTDEEIDAQLDGQVRCPVCAEIGYPDYVGGEEDERRGGPRCASCSASLE